MLLPGEERVKPQRSVLAKFEPWNCFKIISAIKLKNFPFYHMYIKSLNLWDSCTIIESSRLQRLISLMANNKLFNKLKNIQKKGQLREIYSHLIFQMTATLTTISANRRPRATIQVLVGSNNNLFIHSTINCKLKSGPLDFLLFLRTAILDIQSVLGRATFFGNCFVYCYWLCEHSVFSEDFPIKSRRVSMLLKPQHGEIVAAVCDCYCCF